MLQAHGTGTALGDPVEVGAAIRSLCQTSEVLCTSLKANMGHLEAPAAGAGIASLLMLMQTACLASNAQL